MLTLHHHPLSSYSHKVLIALYETATPFEQIVVNYGDPASRDAFFALWPLGKIPVLADSLSGLALPETTIIIEYLDRHHPGPRPLLPRDEASNIEARLLDRLFDNYIHTPMQKLVNDKMRPEDAKDPAGVTQARQDLQKAYAVLDQRLRGRDWAAGADFSLADCAAAPALLYADWSYAIPKHFENLWAYRDRLLARPSYARALDEARPYRHYFPLGAPEGRD